jgi:hypothetical protein
VREYSGCYYAFRTTIWIPIYSQNMPLFQLLAESSAPRKRRNQCLDVVGSLINTERWLHCEMCNAEPNCVCVIKPCARILHFVLHSCSHANKPEKWLHCYVSSGKVGPHLGPKAFLSDPTLHQHQPSTLRGSISLASNGRLQSTNAASCIVGPEPGAVLASLLPMRALAR